MKSKSYHPTTEDIQREWHLIDAKGKALGRLSTEVAAILRGKNKAYFTPNVDCGDFVTVINAKEVVLTGKKLDQKVSFRHSGHTGGDKYVVYRKLMAEAPEKAVLKAVKGMLPKNRLADRQITRLKVYKGSEHPHGAQISEK